MMDRIGGRVGETGLYIKLKSTIDILLGLLLVVCANVS